jgi:uncharacterized protein YndB with AHSA1/START domain
VIEDDLVIHELELTASPDAVFQMFVDPEKLIRWIGISADLEPLPGGTFRFEIEPGQFCEGEYVEVDPPRRLVFTWGWTDPWFGLPPGFSRVEVDLEASGSGTRLRLVHRQLPGQIRLLHDEGWAAFLRRLDDVLAARSVSAYPVGRPQERQAKL